MVTKKELDMERNMDLIRAMLLKAEEHEHGLAPKMEIEGYTQEQIGYHATLLGEAGLAKVIEFTSHQSESPDSQIVRLTWAGHEFLDAARDKTIWNKAKDKISKFVGTTTLQVWLMVLNEVAKNQLGF